MDMGQYFLNWRYEILKAHWPALGVVDSYPIHKKRTEKLRQQWIDQNPRFSALKPLFFGQIQASVNTHPDYDEWVMLLAAKNKKQITYHKYHLPNAPRYDFHEGDIFKQLEEPKHGVQVLNVKDSMVSFIRFVVGESSSPEETLSIEDFVDMLKG